MADSTKNIHSCAITAATRIQGPVPLLGHRALVLPTQRRTGACRYQR